MPTNNNTNNLPSSVDSLESVDANHHRFYTKSEDGKFNLNATSILDGYLAKTKALDSERKIRSDKEKELKEFQTKYTDIDVEEFNTLRQQKTQWEQDKSQQEQAGLEAKGKYEEALAKIKEGHTKDIDAYKKQVSGLNTQIQELTDKYSNAESDKKNYILTDKVKNAAIKSGIFAEDIEDVLTLTRKRFDLTEENKITIKDDDGIVMNDVTLDNFFGEYFKSRKPKFYSGTNAVGSGATPIKPSNPTGSDMTKTAVQKISAGLSQGIKKASKNSK